MADAKLFFGGVPTAPDVDKLNEAFPDLVRNGRILTHQEIEVASGLVYGTNRYQTVVQAWRKRLAKKGIILSGRKAKGKGYAVLTGDQIVDYAQEKIQHAGRKVKHAVIAVSHVPDNELSTERRRYRDQLIAQAASLLQGHLGFRKALAVPKPVEAAPIPPRVSL